MRMFRRAGGLACIGVACFWQAACSQSFGQQRDPAPGKTRGILTDRPRILINRKIADTWSPTENRLDAIIRRVKQRGPAQQDLAALRASVDSGDIGHCTHDGKGRTTACDGKSLGAIYSDNAAYLGYAAPAFLYQIYTGLGDTVSADTYADLVINAGILNPRTCWNLNTCDASTDAVMLGLEGMATAADWVWPRIQSRGVVPQVVASLQRAAQQLSDARFQRSLRESDFHNYSVGWWSAMLAIGLALHGEDPAADALIDKAWGILDEGYRFAPTAFGEAFPYNLKVSIDVLTEGAMNWEGPRYWRSAVPEIVRSIEAYDTATGRMHNVWPKDFANTYRAGLYKIYMLQPDGTQPGIGDSSTGDVTAGRDNFAMVVLLDRFKQRAEAGYLKTYIDQVPDPWDAGQAGALGLVWKLMFYPYSGVASKPYSDLPLAARFGNDIVVRTGWTPRDTYFAMQAGYTGAYHRGLEQGAFHLFGGGAPLLLKGAPYIASDGYYFHQYLRRTIAANGGLLIYDSSECWRDSSAACTLSNDGGQRWPWRRFNPPYTRSEYGISHLWSGALLDPSVPNDYAAQYAAATAGLQSGPGYAYIKSDLTKAYVNRWSVDPDKPSEYTPNHNTNKRVSLVTRDVIVFTAGGDIAMFDRVHATRSSFPKKLVLHSIEPPKIGATPGRAGDHSYHEETALSLDSGKGRLFARVLLPASPTIRVVGGDVCPNLPITGITSAPAAVVTTAAPHRMTTGEVVGMVFTSSRYGPWASLSANNGSYPYLYAEVLSPTTFKLKNSNGTDMNTSSFPQPPTAGATLVWHESCGFEAILDDFADPLNPAHRIRKNAWIPSATYTGGSFVAQYRMEIQPSSPSLNDSFLMVYRATTTSDGNPPAAALIDSTEFSGAFMGGAKAAIFAKGPTPLERGSYRLAHAGTCLHVVSGLAPNRSFTVQQNGAAVGAFSTGTEGALAFSETGGGTFTIAPAAGGR